MKATILIMATLVILAVPAALAQPPVDPVVAHVQEKASHVQQDPQAFVTSHASREAVDGEVAWATDYACAQVTAVPPPEALCPKDPDVAAGAEEEAVADAEPLEATADQLTQDATEAAEALVEELRREPSGAPSAILRFLDAVVSALVDAVASVLVAIEEVLAQLGLGLRDLGLAAVAARDGVVAAASGTLDALGQATAAVGDAATSAAEGLGDAVEGTTSWVKSLLGQAEVPSPQKDTSRRPDVGEPVAPVDDLLGRLPVDLERV